MYADLTPEMSIPADSTAFTNATTSSSEELEYRCGIPLTNESNPKLEDEHALRATRHRPTKGDADQREALKERSQGLRT
jgi:hypothetical protein